MKENEVKKAFDKFEPEAGARERMYANILKKAAVQKETQTAAPAAAKKDPDAAKRRSPPTLRRWGGLAACLAIVMIAAGLALPHLLEHSGQESPPVLMGSPFEDVQSAADFEKLGFTIDAPEGAENVTYCIYDGAIARVGFTLDGHEYTYEAAKLDGNFSCAEGDAVGSTVLNAEYGAALDRLPSDSWRAHWSADGVSYYLTNFDGAEETAVTAAANALMENN